MARKTGFVHLYTGDGEGKTVQAFGLALRTVGHGYKVIIVQFMKGRSNVGEYKACRKLANCEIKQFGRKYFVNLEAPLPEDYEQAKKGMDFARKALKRRPRLLVLDEINLAASAGLVKTKDVLELLDEVPLSTVVVLTGRRAPKALRDRADLVTELKEVKHPMGKGVAARKGIEY